jgi:hypothetical protein
MEPGVVESKTAMLNSFATDYIFSQQSAEARFMHTTEAAESLLEPWISF